MSSNPYDYIKEDKNYDDILQLGNDAFQYMLKSLENSRENGLNEYIMAMACSDMLEKTLQIKHGVPVRDGMRVIWLKAKKVEVVVRPRRSLLK